MERLDLVPFYVPGRQGLLDRLEDALAASFRAEVRRRRPWFDPELSFDPGRGQYRSTVLLRQLLGDEADDSGRVLGVTGVDLCTPILTYVFGEAQLNGRAAIVSFHRLRTEVYGLPADDELLFLRLLKESVHELGHTYGLVHCPDPACVMRASTYVEEIDLKSAAFCYDCGTLVRRD